MRVWGDPSPGTGDTNVPTITIIANRTTQKQRRSRADPSWARSVDGIGSISTSYRSNHVSMAASTHITGWRYSDLTCNQQTGRRVLAKHQAKNIFFISFRHKRTSVSNTDRDCYYFTSSFHTLPLTIMVYVFKRSFTWSEAVCLYVITRYCWLCSILSQWPVWPHSNYCQDNFLISSQFLQIERQHPLTPDRSIP